jgi:hypothetical protein
LSHSASPFSDYFGQWMSPSPKGMYLFLTFSEVECTGL